LGYKKTEAVEMPQEKHIPSEEAVCQYCLEKEIGNWMNDGAGPEIARVISDSFGYLLHEGICKICGNRILNSAILNAGIGFDTLSEELEIEGYDDELLLGKSMMLN